MKRQWLLMTMILLLFCSCNDDEQNLTPTTLEGKIDQYLELNQSANGPGLSIAVRKDDQLVYHKAKGVARIDVNQTINADTQFRIGSVSKPITAIATMQLVENGILELDDLLLSFYPELPASFEGITVQHLLAHRSGLLDYIDDNNNLSSLNNLNMQDALAFISDPNSGFQNLEFEPGTGGRYSNTGYVLLALIIEKVTGETLPEYLQKNVFDPAGMQDTFVISEDEHLDDQGDNYAMSFGTTLNVLGFNSLIYGASGVASTTSDMILFVEALLDHELINKETLDLMTATQGAVPNIQTDYGLGWLTGTGTYWHTGWITDPSDYWHTGGFDGYRSVLSVNPDLKLEIILLTNGGEVTRDKMWALMEIVRTHYKQ